MPLDEGILLEQGRQRGVYTHKRVVILPLLARIVGKWLQICIDLLHIITSTGDGLFRFINIDNLELPRTLKIRVFGKKNFCDFWLRHTF